LIAKAPSTDCSHSVALPSHSATVPWWQTICHTPAVLRQVVARRVARSPSPRFWRGKTVTATGHGNSVRRLSKRLATVARIRGCENACDTPPAPSRSCV
jgi:hypothetical protein